MFWELKEGKIPVDWEEVEPEVDLQRVKSIHERDEWKEGIPGQRNGRVEDLERGMRKVFSLGG